MQLEHVSEWSRARKLLIAALIASFAALAAAVGWNVWNSELFRSAPQKSIAVLPFETLSRDPDSAFFTDGVQDEILTDLARVADLKVISRTSTMQYKSGVARDLRRIGHELGVANVLEGSIQRSGNRVRVNVHLVDARSHRHLWGQTYDRNLTDVFAIQSDIAKTIANQLQAKLSSEEKGAIERQPTTDITAFDLCTQAKNLLLTAFSREPRARLLQAVDLLNQAVARDPSFFDAYCQIAYAHDALYQFGFDHTAAGLASAEAAIEAAFRLRPDAGEAHFARARNLYWAHLDYNGALAELKVARQTLPNDAQIVFFQGAIERRLGRWEESRRDLERVIELDPRNVDMFVQTALNYRWFRRYAEEISLLERTLTIQPNDAVMKAELASVDLDQKGDARPLRAIIDSVRARDPAAAPSITDFRLTCALAEGNAVEAENALIALGDKAVRLVRPNNVIFSRPFVEGLIGRMAKDDNKARAAFTAARAEQEKAIETQPNYGPPLCVLGLIDAALGRKEEALREGRRAVELLPVEKDAFQGPVMLKYFAIIAAWVGDKDLACEQIATVIRGPSDLSYGQMKLMPFWDPLRGDPRFEKIVASLAPKGN
jgi:TolB-like protein/Tfp pilus assembly protein PilF